MRFLWNFDNAFIKSSRNFHHSPWNFHELLRNFRETSVEFLWNFNYISVFLESPWNFHKISVILPRIVYKSSYNASVWGLHGTHMGRPQRLHVFPFFIVLRSIHLPWKCYEAFTMKVPPWNFPETSMERLWRDFRNTSIRFHGRPPWNFRKTLMRLPWRVPCNFHETSMELSCYYLYSSISMKLA